ncbi:MAG: AMP-binding protein [Calditrichia bacterium]
MGFSQKLYKYGVILPIFFLRGENYPACLKQAEAFQWWPEDDQKSWQNKKLKNLLKVAREQVPFYQERYQALGAALSDFSIEDITRLPFVTKADLKARHGDLINPHFKGRVTVKTTGGSTGQAVTVHKNRSATAWEQAANWRGFRWAGLDLGAKQARFWGVPFSQKDRLRTKLIDWAAHRLRLSAFSFSEADLERYLEELNRFKPDYFYGYVSMLNQFAEFLERRNLRLNFSPKAVITTSEVLTAVHRERFERVFRTRVFVEYGCGEIGTIAHECEEGSLHVNADNVILEILNEDRHCRQGELGEIVVTELNNVAMPLIRYRMGDFASFAKENCPCGRTLPVIENIAGRAYDLVYNREGKLFHGEFFMYIFEQVKQKNLGVNAFQVIQEDTEHFTIKIQPGPNYGPETEKLITRLIHEGYGDYAQIRFQMVEKIEREKSGKMRLIVGMKSPNSK